MGNRIRLEDIARECGVTKGLVSRALAGKYNVSDETKNRIVKKALELGYDKGRLRSAVKPLSRVVLVIPSRLLFKEDYWQPIIKSVAKTLDFSSITLDYFVYEEGKLDEESLSKLASSACSAYILIHSNPTPINDRLKDLGKPVVEVDPKTFHSDCITKVKFSNYDSLYEATEMLIGKGHRILAFYGSDAHSTSFRERHEGFLAAIASHKGEGIAGVSLDFDNSSLNYSDDAMLERALREKRITALLCANDIIALNAYKVIARIGMRIPDDISVTGFDNVREGQEAIPALTTFNVPREELGKEIADYLLGMFSERRLQYSQIVVHCPLVRRDSTRRL
ncbi:MAG: LacI family transcriptional regulator [Bacilli bacterium]|jgi:LacI family transcriptional regulator|nr:LacI family transcriptional regulator [Bacilli bacterium]MCI2111429.1 LacI family transcriptional regulator [Bacilli bacterium]